jgi:hypothetical protein
MRNGTGFGLVRQAIALAAVGLGSSAPGTAQGTWTETSTVDAPRARCDHASAWTGSEMIVWGGRSALTSGDLNTGGLYDPASNTWTATSTAGAPSARSGATAVWTASEMIVWGGYVGFGGTKFNTGGIYKSAPDTWTPTSTAGAPSARGSHTAVWTGSRMIVWGGSTGTGVTPVRTGGIYDPATDTWATTSTVGAPSARYDHTAVWTGSKMIVWGGYELGSDLNTGGIYDPATDTWTATSTAGAPTGRSSHTAVWTGSKMIVWGGTGFRDTGGVYDPATDTWTATNTVGAPSGREYHTAVWTGSTMIVWGGRDCYASGCEFNTGGLFHPATNTWTATPTLGAPGGRYYHTAVWTGSTMIVWGGYNHTVVLNTGGAYGPAALGSLSIGDATVVEGNAGTVNALFTVTLAPASAQTVTVDFASEDGTATAPSDYGVALGTVTFTPGQTTQQVTVIVNGDAAVEPDETFFVNLSNPTSAIIAHGQGVGTITNDDIPGISIDDVAVREGGTAIFTLTLWPPSPLTVSVDYATADGSATAGSDYTYSSGVRTFLPGTTTQSLSVPVSDDTTPEPNESFFVDLSGPVNARIVGGQAVGTIVDDDASDFYTIAPCRVFDTRETSGPTGGAPLACGAGRSFTIVGGTCGVPANAKAVSLNLTVTGSTAQGNVRIYPSGAPIPLVSALNYVAGQSRANNAVAVLGVGGQIAVLCSPSGATHVIMDVNGYFQ